MSLILVPPAPTGQILTVDEAKQQCRVVHALDDIWFQDAVTEAGQRVEDRTGRQMYHATWKKTLDAWPCEGWIEIPKPPLVSVVSIDYVETGGTTLTWGTSNYRVDIPSGRIAERGRIARAYAVTWPVIQDVVNAISVTFIAGYGTTPDVVPGQLKRAAKMLISHWYENREAVQVGTISEEIAQGFEDCIRDYISNATQRED